MQAQIGTRQGKGIHGAVAPQQNLPGIGFIQLGRQVPALAGCRQQGLPNALHVLGEDGVIHVIRVTVELARNAVPQPALGTGRHVGAITQVGQGGAGGARAFARRFGQGTERHAGCY